jgi:hypothetical protein
MWATVGSVAVYDCIKVALLSDDHTSIEEEVNAMAAVAIDFTRLFANIPSGAWVALSCDCETVLAFGSDVNTVMSEAKNRGEEHPVIVRVPESPSCLML